VARQQAVSAQRVRPWLTYTLPYLAGQARIELTRVYVAARRPRGCQDAHA
jgi:hypothetical protein